MSDKVNPLKEAIGREVERLVAALEDADASEAYPSSDELDLGDGFQQQVTRKAAISREKAALESEEERINVSLGSMLVELGVLGVVTPAGKVRIQQGSTSHIDKMELLKRGVKASVIEKATVTSTYPQVRFYPNKKETASGS